MYVPVQSHFFLRSEFETSGLLPKKYAADWLTNLETTWTHVLIVTWISEKNDFS